MIDTKLLMDLPAPKPSCHRLPGRQWGRDSCRSGNNFAHPGQKLVPEELLVLLDELEEEELDEEELDEEELDEEELEDEELDAWPPPTR